MVPILSLPRKFSTTIDIFLATRFFPFVYRKAGLLRSFSIFSRACRKRSVLALWRGQKKKERKVEKQVPMYSYCSTIRRTRQICIWMILAGSSSNKKSEIHRPFVHRTYWRQVGPIAHRSVSSYPGPETKPAKIVNTTYTAVRTGHKSVSFFSLVLYSA